MRWNCLECVACQLLLCMIVSELIVTADGRFPLEIGLLGRFGGLGDAERYVEARVALLLGYGLNRVAKLRWAAEHRRSPLTDIKIASWIIQTNNGPRHRLQALLHRRVELANLDDQIGRCLDVSILVLG